MAYDVTTEGQRTMPVRVKVHNETFPGYLTGRLHNLHNRQEDLMAKVDEIEYLSRKRRNRLQLSSDDVSMPYIAS